MTPRPIAFVTGNNGKFQDFQTEIGLYGLAGERVTLDLIEPQEASLEQIALAKARQAHAALQRPLIVEDSGLCIPALNDFPEALTKPVIGRLGLDGFLKVLEAVEDRRCYFRCALAYVDAHGAFGTILSEHEDGEILRAPQGELSGRARSLLWQIFRPTGFETAMAAMDGLTLARLFAMWREQNTFKQFAQLASGEPARFGVRSAA